MTTPCPVTSMNSAPSLRDALTRLSQAGLVPEFLASQTNEWTEGLNGDWPVFAHGHQEPPPGLTAGGLPWRTWLILGGRGAGKTRAGAEWVRGVALGRAGFFDGKVGRIALVGETEHDVREVMIEGVSGLLAVHARHERPLWIPSRRRVEWSTGAV